MIVAVIPARGGSKRIKKKNIKNFLNKPIIYYPIKQIQKSKLFDKIIVSTDSKEDLGQKFCLSVQKNYLTIMLPRRKL